jgi:hypothetical protein
MVSFYTNNKKHLSTNFLGKMVFTWKESSRVTSCKIRQKYFMFFFFSSGLFSAEPSGGVTTSA